MAGVSVVHQCCDRVRRQRCPQPAGVHRIGTEVLGQAGRDHRTDAGRGAQGIGEHEASGSGGPENSNTMTKKRGEPRPTLCLVAAAKFLQIRFAQIRRRAVKRLGQTRHLHRGNQGENFRKHRIAIVNRSTHRNDELSGTNRSDCRAFV